MGESSKAWTRDNKREKREGMMKETDRKKDVEVKEEGMGREGERDEGQRGWRGTGRRKGWRVAREGIYSQGSYSSAMQRFSSPQSWVFMCIC